MADEQFAVHVFVQVRPRDAEAFRVATVANAELARREAGITRFELLQQSDDPDRFVLVEGYANEEAVALHKETEHYARWRDTVAPMMAQPRTSVRYRTVS